MRKSAVAFAAAALVLAGGWTAPAAAAPSGARSGSLGRKVRIEVGRSHVLSFEKRLKRVSIADQKVAEVVVVSPREVLINGKAEGTSAVVIWDETGAFSTYDVTVFVRNKLVRQLRRRLASLLPKERNLRVDAVGKGVVLSGAVSSEEAREVALRVAEALVPKKVVDNLQVEEVPQVLIKVHFAEISRSGAIKVGWSFIRHRHGQTDVGIFPGAPGFSPSGPFLPPTQGLPGPDLTFSGVIDLFLGNSARTSGFFLRALQERGYIRTLAEPNLRVMSGKEASFLVGGQVPVPVPGQDGQVTIMYRDFGIKLKFKPKVRKSGMIELAVEPEVSSIDTALAVVVSGFNVPGFKTSNTKTQVVLRDGQSMAISGLLSESRRKNIAQLPFIGDVPILGELFRSRDFTNDKTELVVLVTPKILRTRRVEEVTLSRGGFEVGRMPDAPAPPGGAR